jgi:hypothetical protein
MNNVIQSRNDMSIKELMNQINQKRKMYAEMNPDSIERKAILIELQNLISELKEADRMIMEVRIQNL